MTFEVRAYFLLFQQQPSAKACKRNLGGSLDECEQRAGHQGHSWWLHCGNLLRGNVAMFSLADHLVALVL